MKKALLSLVSTLLVFNTQAQPNFRVDDYEPKGDKKASYYNSQAKKHEKNNKINTSLLCASYALEIATKKKDISKAQDFLRRRYASQVEYNLKTIAEYKSATETFKNDHTVTMQADILNMYMAMNKYNKVLRELPKSKFTPVKKKEKTVELIIADDYGKAISKALLALEKGKRKAAEMHYSEGYALYTNNSKDKRTYRNAARRFRYASGYLQGYKDADELFLLVKQRGTVSLGIMPFDDPTGKCGLTKSEVSAKVATHIRKQNIEFVDVKGYQQDILGDVSVAMVSALVSTLSGSNKKKARAQDSIEQSKYDLNTGDIEDIKKSDYVLYGNIIGCKYVGNIEEKGVRDFSKEVVLRTETYTDAQGKTKKRDVKGVVTAKAMLKKKYASIKVTSRYRMVSENGNIIWSEEKTKSSAWDGEWYIYKSGDKRALPDNTKEPKAPDVRQRAASSLGSEVAKGVEKFIRNEVKD